MATKAAQQWTRRNKQGSVIAEGSKKTKRGEYHITPGSRQAALLSAVELSGFDGMPTGLYASGAGLTGAGYFLADRVFKKWRRKFRLVIAAAGTSKITRDGSRITVRLNHGDMRRLNAFSRRVKAEGNEEIRREVQDFLNTVASRFFPTASGAGSRSYSGGELADLLGKDDVLGNLTNDDRDSLNGFITDYVKRTPITLRSDKKLQVIFDLIAAGRKVYLEEVVKDFEKRLNASAQNENRWQEFLRKHILILRNSYGEVLEKQSVTLSGKFPDFMLIDPYHYLDVYEIKRPDTKLLGYDKSRGNYYWDTELAKAISQVENYIHQIQRNSDTLINEIRRAKGVDISVVRPRGYIVAGRRSSLANDTMGDYFRILNESLKNVDILFYDDLLEGLKTFMARLSGSSL